MAIPRLNFGARGCQWAARALRSYPSPNRTNLSTSGRTSGSRGKHTDAEQLGRCTKPLRASIDVQEHALCQANHAAVLMICQSSSAITTVWPSGLRRWLQAPVRKGVGSNPTAVMAPIYLCLCPMSPSFGPLTYMQQAMHGGCAP